MQDGSLNTKKARRDMYLCQSEYYLNANGNVNDWEQVQQRHDLRHEEHIQERRLAEWTEALRVLALEAEEHNIPQPQRSSP